MNQTLRKTPATGNPPTAADLRPQIETRAYELWEAEGGGSGNALGHWFQAQNEVLELETIRSKSQRSVKP